MYYERIKFVASKIGNFLNIGLLPQEKCSEEDSVFEFFLLHHLKNRLVAKKNS